MMRKVFLSICQSHPGGARYFTKQLKKQSFSLMDSYHNTSLPITTSNFQMNHNVVQYHTNSSFRENVFSSENIESSTNNKSTMVEPSIGLESVNKSMTSVESKSTKEGETKPKRRRPLRPTKQLFQVTEGAADRLKQLLSKNNNAVGLGVGVKRRGCNGYSYTLDYVSEAPKFAEIVEDKGIKIFIDPKAMMFVVGTTMDFIEDEIRSEFVFQNPNSKGECGCGESFTV